MTIIDRSIGTPPYTYGKVWYQDTVNTPNYKTLMRTHQPLPINPFMQYKEELVDPMYWTYNGWRNCHTAGYPLRWMIANELLPNGYDGFGVNRAIDLVKNRLAKSSRSIDVDLGVALGELPETCRMISTIAGQLGLAAKAVRRKDPQGVVRHLFGTNAAKKWKDVPKSASSTWLGYSYGVRPLVSDVYAGVEALEEGLKRPNRSRVLTRMPVNINANKTFSQTSQGHAKRSGSVTGVCTGMIEYEVASPSFATMGSLGLVNPLNIAWELVPLSFVVDWFLPVGDFINSLAPPAGLSFKRGWITVKASGTVRHIVKWPNFYTDGQVTASYKRRIVLTEFPRFALNFDDLTFSLNKQQVASSLSLLTQRALK